MERAFIETKMIADDSGAISGLGWPFKTGDRVGDWIEKGAFADTKLPLPMLFGHDPNDPVGAWNEAIEDDEGLQVKGKLLIDDLPRAKEVRALIDAGAVRGLSVGFVTKKAAPRQGGGRTIKSLELLEISLVSMPMNPGAQITSAKSMVEALKLSNEIQRATAHFNTR